MAALVACSTAPYEAFPIECALQGISKAGFKDVVVGPAHAGSSTVGLGPGGASALAEGLWRAGVKLFALAPELAPTDDETEAAIKSLLERAKELSAKQLWVAGPDPFDESGEPRPDSDWERDVREFAARFVRLSAEAQKLGIELALVTQARLSGCAEDVARLQPLVGDALRLAYNPGLVSYYSGTNPRRDIEAVLPHVRALCLRDHKGARGEPEFPQLGGGDVDYFGIRELFAGGAVPPVVVEHLNGSSPEELDRSAAAAYRFASMLFR